MLFDRTEKNRPSGGNHAMRTVSCPSLEYFPNITCANNPDKLSQLQRTLLQRVFRVLLFSRTLQSTCENEMSVSNFHDHVCYKQQRRKCLNHDIRNRVLIAAFATYKATVLGLYRKTDEEISAE